MSQSNASDLTVVIPAYNAARSISNAVASAFRAGAVRVVVVDDGSSDNTASVATAAGAEVIVQENSGASVARSRGAQTVETTFVTFLDADDELLADGVTRSLELLVADDSLAVAAGRVMGFVGDGDAKILPQTYTEVNTRSLLVNGFGPWPPGAAVQRTALMRQAESVEPEALRPRFAEDYELLIRLSLVGGIVRHEIPSMKYEMAGGKSALSAMSALESKEAIREHYARNLGISIELMSSMRMRAAANKRVARGRVASGDKHGARRQMFLAYLQGAVSLLQRKRTTPGAVEVGEEEFQALRDSDAFSREDLLVMESTTRPPDGTTRYIDQIVTFSNDSTKFVYFSWRSAFFSRYDVLHVHWPEIFLRKSSYLRRMVASVLLATLLVVLKLRGVPIVRTLHNIEPHESGSRLERVVLAALDKSTTLFVTINPVTVAPNSRSIYIPHGHYRDRFKPYEKNTAEAGRLVYAGIIRPYKGVERLISAYENLPAGKARELRIVGNPTAELREVVESAAQRNTSISAVLEFVPDDRLVAEITRAELVCLPYGELHNSGIALVALSLDRPLLVPSTPTTRALAAEVGNGWLHFFEGNLDAEKLADAIAENLEWASQRSKAPLLDERDWESIGARYDSAFRLAIGLRRADS